MVSSASSSWPQTFMLKEKAVFWSRAAPGRRRIVSTPQELDGLFYFGTHRRKCSMANFRQA